MLGNFVVDVCFKLSESMFAKHTHTFFILSALQFIQIWCVCVCACHRVFSNLIASPLLSDLFSNSNDL